MITEKNRKRSSKKGAGYQGILKTIVIHTQYVGAAVKSACSLTASVFWSTASKYVNACSALFATCSAALTSRLFSSYATRNRSRESHAASLMTFLVSFWIRCAWLNMNVDGVDADVTSEDATKEWASVAVSDALICRPMLLGMVLGSSRTR